MFSNRGNECFFRIHEEEISIRNLERKYHLERKYLDRWWWMTLNTERVIRRKLQFRIIRYWVHENVFHLILKIYSTLGVRSMVWVRRKEEKRRRIRLKIGYFAQKCVSKSKMCRRDVEKTWEIRNCWDDKLKIFTKRN